MIFENMPDKFTNFSCNVSFGVYIFCIHVWVDYVAENLGSLGAK
jgi:hypothetical protein